MVIMKMAEMAEGAHPCCTSRLLWGTTRQTNSIVLENCMRGVHPLGQKVGEEQQSRVFGRVWSQTATFGLRGPHVDLQGLEEHLTDPNLDPPNPGFRRVRT